MKDRSPAKNSTMSREFPAVKLRAATIRTKISRARLYSFPIWHVAASVHRERAAVSRWSAALVTSRQGGNSNGINKTCY